MSQEKYLVTSALPYANGPLHIGHIAGAYLPADIFVRYNKMKGNDIIYICGSDEHGVPITIKASQEGVSPKDIVDRYHKNIAESFKKLDIDFDHFSGTARPVHHKLSQEFFLDLHKNNYISEKEIDQYYCDHDKMFLPDRYLEGICPNCRFEKARGDECPKCGKWLEPEKLMDPRCKLCNNPPAMRSTRHWFLRLDLLQGEIETWIKGKANLKENVRNFALGWMKEGLNQRGITRDISWGVPVPLDHAKDKVLYVWFDAPIGYISSTMEWSEKRNEPDKWKDYWLDPKCKLIHFIGKDNVAFHIIVWPAILMGSGENYILPWNVPANEHLTIEGHKLSTSEGNVVWVDDFLKYFPADYLRFYLSSMAPETKDSDFSWKGFQEKINNELSNVLGNLVNRTLTFIDRYFDGHLPSLAGLDQEDKNILSEITTYPKKIGDLLSQFKVREGIFEVLHLAHLGNRYFDQQKPWSLIKTDKIRCGTVLNTCALIIKSITPLLYPFLPAMSQSLWVMIGEKSPLNEISWDRIKEFEIKSGQKIGKVHLLINKIDDKKLNTVIDELRKTMNSKSEEQSKQSSSEISIEDFHKLDLRIATVEDCEKVEKSNKLLKLQVKMGDETRQIISGVAKDYQPNDLIGQQVLVVANLKKAKLMGQVSEGMILFAEHDGKLTLISPVNPLPEGSKVS